MLHIEEIIHGFRVEYYKSTRKKSRSNEIIQCSIISTSFTLIRFNNFYVVYLNDLFLYYILRNDSKIICIRSLVSRKKSIIYFQIYVNLVGWFYIMRTIKMKKRVTRWKLINKIWLWYDDCLTYLFCSSLRAYLYTILIVK